MIILNYKNTPCLLLRMWEKSKTGFFFEMLYKNKKIRTIDPVLTKNQFELVGFIEQNKFATEEQIKSRQNIKEIHLYDNKL